MSAVDDARQAVNAFAASASASGDATKGFLETAAAPLTQAAKAIGDHLGLTAFEDDVIFSGVTDPFQQTLVKDSMKSFGNDLANENLAENTGNRLNRLFEQAKAATFGLFQTGPDLFYTLASRSGKRLKLLIATVLGEAAVVGAEATAYKTFHDSLDRTDLDTFDVAMLTQVKNNTQDALAQMDLIVAQVNRQGTVRPSQLNNAIAAIESICIAFNHPGGMIAFLFMQDILAKLDRLDRDVLLVIAAKAEFAAVFGNTLDSDVSEPIARTIGTVRDQVASSLVQVTALAGQAFSKFAGLNQAVQMCLQAHVFIQGLLKTPQAVKVDIQAHVQFPTFSSITDAIAAETNGPAQAYLLASQDFRKAARSVLVADIRPQLALKTSALVSAIAGLEAWLATMEAVLVGLPIVNDAAVQIVDSLLGGSALDRTNTIVQGANIKELANTAANTASRAGAAAQAIGEVIEELPESRANRAGALADVRSSLLAIEAAQVIATESMLEETPGAITEVDTFAQEVERIQQETEALLS